MDEKANEIKEENTLWRSFALSASEAFGLFAFSIQISVYVTFLSEKKKKKKKKCK
jgi:hypothetical protein